MDYLQIGQSLMNGGTSDTYQQVGQELMNGGVSNSYQQVGQSLMGGNSNPLGGFNFSSDPFANQTQQTTVGFPIYPNGNGGYTPNPPMTPFTTMPRTVGFPIYPNGNGGYTLYPPTTGGLLPTTIPPPTGQQGIAPTTGGLIPTGIITNNNPASSSTGLVVNEGVNTPFGNFNTSISIPNDQFIKPPAEACNTALSNVASALPGILNNAFENAPFLSQNTTLP